MEAEKRRNRADSGIQLVTFRLGAESYGVPVWMVKEIIRPIDTFKVPGMTHNVEGVINLRGVIIPILRIHFVLGVKSGDGGEETRKTRIIILDAERDGFGFIVDEVMEVVRVSSEDVQPSPDVGKNGSFEEAVIGIVQISGQMVICIDPRKLVAGCLDAKEFASSC
ncbi:MAG: purine-binding chemotaxis protein CheW [Candidatus Krumholzibacteria bacterium]|nr:purine-binding chemotaxis protein CheW [Candidatus Krumholzibacteria bacterium]